MQFQQKIKLLEELALVFRLSANSNLTSNELNDELVKKIEEAKKVFHAAKIANPWFTIETITYALESWAMALSNENIETWLSGLKEPANKRTLGLICAGNIPLVGLHDLLCGIMAEQTIKIKLSSKDSHLMLWVIEILFAISPELKAKIEPSTNLKDIDFLIATGSDNSARYFDYYFKDVPKIIRKNRSSIAILNGNETQEELEGLSNDVFTYFGLGCRNVSKVYLPKDYDKNLLFAAFYKHRGVVQHNKYANNYDYNKSVYLMNSIELIENGFLLLKEDNANHAPIGVLFYEYYEDLKSLESRVSNEMDQLQCIVSSLDNKSHTSFGKTQSPELWDYADHIDTLDFLLN